MNSNSALQVVTDNDLRGEQVCIFGVSYCSSGLLNTCIQPNLPRKCTHMHHASLLCRQLNNVSLINVLINHHQADMTLHIVSLAW